jgi:DNA replication protein DnaC
LSQAEANESSHLHVAEGLIEQEMQQRNGKRIEQNKRRARFSWHKSLEEFDYRFQTTFSKREINGLLDSGFIDNRENVVFIGPSGVGKPIWPLAWDLKPSMPVTKSASTRR